MSLGIRQPEFGQRLRALRESGGLSQRDLAGDAVDPSYISLLESGARLPTLKVVARLGQALGVPLHELVGPGRVPGSGNAARDDRLVSDILARSALGFGDLTDARTRFTEAYSSARQRGEIAAALEYGITLQEVLWLRGDNEGRYRLLVELTPLAEKLGVPELALTVEVSRAAAARDTDRLREGLRLAEHAFAGIDDTRFARTTEHVRTVGVLISLRCDTDRPVAAGALIGTMLDVATGLGSAAIAGRAHWAVGLAYAELGDGERARAQVRLAQQRLATPVTSLREWARFSRAAASILLDVGADLAEVEPFLRGAQATLSMVDVPGEAALLQLATARYALAGGDPRGALLRLSQEPPGLRGADLVRLRVVRGRALRALGRHDEAIAALRSAAELGERLEQFKRVAGIWRDIDDLRLAAVG